MKSKAGSKGGTEKGRKLIPTSVGAFEKEDQSLPRIITEFVSHIRLGVGVHKGDKEPLDDQDQKSFVACLEMATHVARITAMIKIILAVVAYKIDEEKLWRGEFSNKVKCIKKLTGLKESTIHRYVACGRVIHAVIDKCGISSIPNSLDALTPFTWVENDKEILKTFKAAMTIASTEGKAITKKIAKNAVAKLGIKARQNKPNSAAAQATPSSKTPNETSKDIRKQMHALSKTKITDRAVLTILMQGVTDVAEQYLKKSHKKQYLEEVKPSAHELYKLFEAAVSKAKS